MQWMAPYLMEKIMPSLSFDRVAHLYDATQGQHSSLGAKL
jgi:hypothetical protein